MRPGPTFAVHRRVWTVTIDLRHGVPALSCLACGPLPLPRAIVSRGAVLAHLARHIRGALLSPHLRICQCGQQGCRWHPRHRGSDGPILLLLARSATGRTWRLADVCRACAAATPHAAPVPHTFAARRAPAELPRLAAASGSATGQGNRAAGGADTVYLFDPLDHNLWEMDR